MSFELYALVALVILPLVAAGLLALLPVTDRAARVGALATVLVTTAIAIKVFITYQAGAQLWMFEAQSEWLSSSGISVKVAVDGLASLMVLLTGIIGVTSFCFTTHISERQREFYAWYLLVLAGVYGVFIARDLLLFILFYEMASIPVFFLIGLWGSDKSGVGRKVQHQKAALKVLVYLQLGGALVLFGVLGMVLASGTGSFDMDLLQKASISALWQKILFGVFLFGFGIEAGLVPFHTWLPDGHSSAPTALSMLLAGVLLKMGGYGLIRLGIEMLPLGAYTWSDWLAVFGVVNLLYGGLCALRQTDIKVMIAYSSVSHMGMVFLGLSTIHSGQSKAITFGVGGAIYQMFSHGILTSLAFAVAGTLYHYTHERNFRRWGGLASQVPILATFFMVAALGGCSLPGMTGFIAEIAVIIGSFIAFPILLLLATPSFFISALYPLRAVQYGLFGPLNPKLKDTPDAGPIEILGFSILTFVAILGGIYPQVFLSVIEGSLAVIKFFFVI